MFMCEVVRTVWNGAFYPFCNTARRPISNMLRQVTCAKAVAGCRKAPHSDLFSMVTASPFTTRHKHAHAVQLLAHVPEHDRQEEAWRGDA
eukprot:scaffold80821_cov56-Phaeocystis_antarctica.AAC.2